jgi:hypothetical protein
VTWTSPLDALIVLAVLLGATAVSWTLGCLYDRRLDRQEQQRGGGE